MSNTIGNLAYHVPNNELSYDDMNNWIDRVNPTYVSNKPLGPNIPTYIRHLSHDFQSIHIHANTYLLKAQNIQIESKTSTGDAIKITQDDLNEMLLAVKKVKELEDKLSKTEDKLAKIMKQLDDIEMRPPGVGGIKYEAFKHEYTDRFANRKK